MSKFENVIWYCLVGLIILMSILSFFVKTNIITYLVYIAVFGILATIFANYSLIQKLFKTKQGKN